MSKWIETDSDNAQHVREISDGVFELVQAQRIGDGQYGVAYQIIDVDMWRTNLAFRDTLRQCLIAYGYDGIDDLQCQYGDSWKQILVECIFEDGAYFCLVGLDTHIFYELDVACAFVNEYCTLRPLYKDWKKWAHDPNAVCYVGAHVDDPSDCWTKNAIIAACDGDEVKAEIVFDLCEWESPYTVLASWDDEDEAALDEIKRNIDRK